MIESSGKCEMNYYQPNYLPSSGKNVPNNIPKAGASSNGMYKDKLEQQTIISQQVGIYKPWLFPILVQLKNLIIFLIQTIHIYFSFSLG